MDGDTLRWSGGGAWRRRKRRAPSFTATTDEEMQRVVLAAVLREYPALLTLPAIASVEPALAGNSLRETG